MAKRGRPKKVVKMGEPQPCQDCGRPGEYGVDLFGMPSEQWRCRGCHEQACRRNIRDDFTVRYGR